MDDGSTDNTVAIVRAEFPAVQIFTLGFGKGPTFQRNRGAELANAEVLITLDDDCVFSDAKVVERILDLFGSNEVAGVTMPFVNTLTSNRTIWCNAPSAEGRYQTGSFFGGMVALRKDSFIRVGGYREIMFMQGEEPDLALRLLDAGFIIICGHGKCINHLESPVRDNTKLQYLGARNAIYYIWLNAPVVVLPFHLLLSSAVSIRQGFHLGRPITGFRAVFDGLTGIAVCWQWRRPVSFHSYWKMRALRRVKIKLAD